MSKLIVSKLQSIGGPELTLPTIQGIAGQVLALGALNSITFRDITKVVNVAPTSATVASAGDVHLDDRSGVIYYCVAVQTTPSYRSFWLGTGGFAAGFPQGQNFFTYTFDPTSAGSSATTDFSWTVPTGVTAIHAVLVGAGGGGHSTWANSGGGGGALAWANEIPVTPGEVLTVRMQTTPTPIGGNGANTSLLRAGTVLFAAEGGKYGASSFASIAKPIAGTITPGNINSGRGGLVSQNGYGGGGGAGGYSGNGGNGYYGSTGNPNNTLNNTINGTGGAGGGGSGYQSSTYGFAGGGGVGLYGEGTSGTGGRSDGSGSNNFMSDYSYSGSGGSGGERGSQMNNSTSSDTASFGTTFAGMATTTGGGTPSATMTRYHGQGGRFGGGGGGGGTSVSGSTGFCTGGSGGARIIWGKGRAFPSTLTGDVTTVTA